MITNISDNLVIKTLIAPLILLAISLLVFSFALSFFLFKKESRLYLTNLIIAIFNLVFSILITSLYKGVLIKSNTGQIIYITASLLALIYCSYFIIYHFIYGLKKVIEYKLFTKALAKSKWNTYLVISKSAKIKKISNALLDQLGISYRQALNKDCFEVFFKTIRLKQINDVEASNKDLISKYETFIQSLNKNTIKLLELNIYNERGEDVFLNLVVQPLYSYFGYYGLLITGEIKSDFDKLKVERKLDITQNEHKNLEEKFISLLEISQDNLVFSDLGDKSAWLSDNIKNELALPSNTISLDQFRQLICPDDLITRDQALVILTPNNPYFKIKYRLFYRGSYVWYQEYGKKVFTPNSIAIISSLTKINTKHFMASNISELDIIPGEAELNYYIQNLLNQKTYFNCIYFKINNLKKINEENGRDVGNMILAQYITKMQNSFRDNSQNLFRLTGSEFMLVLSDPKKIALFKDGVNRRKDYLNLVAKFGAIDVFADVYAGVAVSLRDGENAKELLTNAKVALGFALDRKYDGQVCFFSS